MLVSDTRVHRRYSSLAIIGPILDGYGTRLLKQGYSTERTREHFQAAPRFVRGPQQRGVGERSTKPGKHSAAYTLKSSEIPSFSHMNK